MQQGYNMRCGGTNWTLASALLAFLLCQVTIYIS